eukprot:gene27220-2467_t
MATEESQLEYGLVSFAGQGSRNFSALVMREIKVLGSLDHPNIVKKLRAFRTPQRQIYLVMEYVEKSLSEMLKARKVFDADELKLLMWELLEATTYMHKKGVMHRDLKPSNVLINSEGSVKICDLGFARDVESTSQPADYTPYITTRWYRAPEVLLGGPYSPNVDVWSLGCIFAELVTGSVLLCGSSSLDQLHVINEVVGCLSPEQSMCLDAGVSVTGHQPGPEKSTLATKLKGQSVGLSHLIKSCLEPDPVHRPTSAQLLNSFFFMDIDAVKLRVKAKQSVANAGPLSCVSAPEQNNHGTDVMPSHVPTHAWPAQAVSAVPPVNTAPTQGPKTSAARPCLAPDIMDSASCNGKVQVQLPAARRITADPSILDSAGSLPSGPKPSSGLKAFKSEASPPADLNIAIVRPNGSMAHETKIQLEVHCASMSTKQFSPRTGIPSVNAGIGSSDPVQDSASTYSQVPHLLHGVPHGTSRPGQPKSKQSCTSTSPLTSNLAAPLEYPQQAMPSGCFTFASLLGSLGLKSKKINKAPAKAVPMSV